MSVEDRMNIGKRTMEWRKISGEDNWDGLLDEPDIELRKWLIQCGEMAQAAYDAFIREKASRFAGACRYTKKDFFQRIGLVKGKSYDYTISRFLYATSKIEVPEAFIVKSLSREVWSKESNWIGYVAFSSDETTIKLGRRDIMIVWRGTVQALEWVENLQFTLCSADEIFTNSDAKVHDGWFSIYTSNDPRSPFCKLSARQQVLGEVGRLVDEFKEENEVSISITGHSMGAAMATLAAVDITVNRYNQRDDKNGSPNPIPVSAFLFSSPKVGDSMFEELFSSQKHLRLLRVRNTMDVVPDYPLVGYSEVGVELKVDTGKSEYMKKVGSPSHWHSLEVYLHGVGGMDGRDVSLMNKWLDVLKEEYMVPSAWWCELNKGMVQQSDGSWKLEDHEIEIEEELHYYGF